TQAHSSFVIRHSHGCIPMSYLCMTVRAQAHPFELHGKSTIIPHMKSLTRRFWLTQLVILAAFFPAIIHAAGTNAPFGTQFSQLCHLAVVKVTNADSKGVFFVDSYAVRAFCAAYDMTGNTNYLNACRQWSDRMVSYQEQMTPHGAYYMHYNRKPGETTNDWY